MGDATPPAPDDSHSNNAAGGGAVLTMQEQRRGSDASITMGDGFRERNRHDEDPEAGGAKEIFQDDSDFDQNIRTQAHMEGGDFLQELEDNEGGSIRGSADRLDTGYWDSSERMQRHRKANEYDLDERVNQESSSRNRPSYAHEDRKANEYAVRSRGDKRGPEIDSDVPSPPPKKIKKKPGPKPGNRPPPIKKDDVRAKKALIRQIEGHWGKDFIKNYIPKYHRPLQKRKKGKPKTSNRKSEDDPMKWMPSVLKAMLSLAAKTDDKALLKKLMGDVVRYRNQHTGNKKPQLVTTDFDCIEDMLDHGWSVGQSFRIRYKHLLTNRDEPTDTKEKDSYYKDLFREELSSDESEEEEEGDEMDRDDDTHELTNDYQMRSGYYEKAPIKPHQRNETVHNSRHTVQQYRKSVPAKKREGLLSNLRMPPTPRESVSSYASQSTRIPYGGAERDRVRAHRRDDYSLLDGPDTYDNGYGGSRRNSYQDTGFERRRPEKADVRTSDSSRIDPRNAYPRNHIIESSPETPLARMRENKKQQHKESRIYKPSPAPRIKAEPVDDEPRLMNGHRTTETRIQRSPSPDTGLMRDDGKDGNGDSEEELRAQLELADARAAAAKLRLQLMAKKRDSSGRASTTNTLNLDD